MVWLQFSIDLSVDKVEETENALLEAGAVSITLQDGADQPIFEPGVNETPLWSATRLISLFALDDNVQSIDATVIAQTRERLSTLLQQPIPSTAITILVDKEWEREWLKHFKPLRCGNRLWICPGWQRPPNPSSINLLLDPGLAFGTGTHETTLMCLEWLDRHDIDNADAIDFGCGSGILGIAALLLGARHALFIDNDPQALTATKDNLSKNNIEKSRFTILPADEFHQQHEGNPFKAGLLLANILAKPLITLAPTLSDCVQPGGKLVLSGILEEQIEMVSDAYLTQFVLDTPTTKNSWVCLSGIKTSSAKPLSA